MIKNPPANVGDLEMRIRSLGGEDLLERGMQPIPMDRAALVGYGS